MWPSLDKNQPSTRLVDQNLIRKKCQLERIRLVAEWTGQTDMVEKLAGPADKVKKWAREGGQLTGGGNRRGEQLPQSTRNKEVFGQVRTNMDRTQTNSRFTNIKCNMVCKASVIRIRI